MAPSSPSFDRHVGRFPVGGVVGSKRNCLLHGCSQPPPDTASITTDFILCQLYAYLVTVMLYRMALQVNIRSAGQAGPVTSGKMGCPPP